MPLTQLCPSKFWFRWEGVRVTLLLTSYTGGVGESRNIANLTYMYIGSLCVIMGKKTPFNLFNWSIIPVLFAFLSDYMKYFEQHHAFQMIFSVLLRRLPYSNEYSVFDGINSQWLPSPWGCLVRPWSGSRVHDMPKNIIMVIKTSLEEKAVIYLTLSNRSIARSSTRIK